MAGIGCLGFAAEVLVRGGGGALAHGVHCPPGASRSRFWPVIYLSGTERNMPTRSVFRDHRDCCLVCAR